VKLSPILSGVAVSFVTCKNLVEFPVKFAEPPVLAVKVVIDGAATGMGTKVIINTSANRVAHFFAMKSRLNFHTHLSDKQVVFSLPCQLSQGANLGILTQWI
jgi:hypothetical protein